MKTLGKFVLIASAAAAALVAVPAVAAAHLIDFEGVTDGARVDGFYAHGTDSAGASGPDLGVSFAGGAIAVRSDVAGALFANAPTPGTALVIQGASATLNFATGFVDTLGLSYSALADARDVVTIFGGLNRSGPVLGEISLSGNAQLDGCDKAALCHWQNLHLSFAGTAKSIGFSGHGKVAFDDIRVTPVPEPGTYAMMALGLAGVMVAAGRRRKA